MKFLSTEVPLYLYKSTIWPCMGYCCYLEMLDSCYLEMLDKLQEWIYRTVVHSIAASLGPLLIVEM